MKTYVLLCKKHIKIYEKQKATTKQKKNALKIKTMTTVVVKGRRHQRRGTSRNVEERRGTSRAGASDVEERRGTSRASRDGTHHNTTETWHQLTSRDVEERRGHRGQQRVNVEERRGTSRNVEGRRGTHRP